MKSILKLANPVFFFSVVLIQDYLVKSTDTYFICTSVFIPLMLYIILKFKKFPDMKSLTYRMLFFGMLLALFDFVNLYIFYKFMGQSSTFLVLSITCFFTIFFINPEILLDLLPNLICIFLVFNIFKNVLQYEIYGKNDNLFFFSEVISMGDSSFCFVFVSCIFRVYIEILAVEDSERAETSNIGAFFLFLYTGVYLILDMPNTFKEGLYAQNYYPLVIISICLSLLWMLTLDEFKPEKYRNYTIVCFIILLLYLIFPQIKILDITRVESSLYYVYMALFVVLVFFFVYVKIQKFLPEDRYRAIEEFFRNRENEIIIVGGNENSVEVPEAGLYATYTP